MISTPALTASVLPVGLGEMCATTSGQLVAFSLGSCVAICLWDPLVKVAGMVHVVLPESPDQGPGPTPGKYADTALLALLELMLDQGAAKSRCYCKIAGGAAVLSIGGGRTVPSIGQRNVEAVRSSLKAARMPIAAESVGGTVGRTVRLQAESGLLTVRKVHGTEESL